MRFLAHVSLCVALAASVVGCKPRPVDTTAPGSGNAPSRDNTKNDGKSDAVNLKGLWAVKSLEGRDLSYWNDERKKQDLEELKSQRVLFDGAKMTIFSQGEQFVQAYKLDESKTPKQIILTLL